MMNSILIIDTQQITLSGLKQLIKTNWPQFEIVDTASEAEAIQLLTTKPFQVCIADISVSAADPLGMIRKLKQAQPALQILILSSFNEDVYSLNTIRAGALGFVSKDRTLREISEALQNVIDNRKYISEQILERLVENPTGSAETNPFLALNNRELEISRQLCQGKTVTQIAESTKLQVSTISTYKSKIFQKLNINNSIELYVLIKAHNILGDNLHDDNPKLM